MGLHHLDGSENIGCMSLEEDGGGGGGVAVGRGGGEY